MNFRGLAASTCLLAAALPYYAETFQVWRWENESTVIDRDIPTESVLVRDEIEYESSAFDVNVPVRIVTSYFMVIHQRSTALHYWLSQTVTSFF
jgi:hypothetical protein